MSHQTGLKCSVPLQQMITSCKSPESAIRVFKVRIDREAELLELAGEQRRTDSATWEDDFARHIPSMIADRQHCYILFRLDRSPHQDDEQQQRQQRPASKWAFIYYAPESVTNVRQKMLYASSKGTLKQHFGTSDIDCDYFADTDDMLTLDGFKRWLVERKRETRPEEFARATDDDRASSTAAGASASSHHHGIHHRPPGGMISSKFEFPLTPEAATACREFQIGKLIYLKLTIVDEAIRCAAKAGAAEHPTFRNRSAPIAVDRPEFGDLKLLPPSTTGAAVLDDNIGFHIVAFEHQTAGGDAMARKNLFILLVPPEAKVRQRMIYSTSTGSLVSTLVNQFAIQIDKRLEVDCADDVTVRYVAEKLYPHHQSSSSSSAASSDHAFDSNAIDNRRFEKPLPPGGRQRGPRRLIK